MKRLSYQRAQLPTEIFFNFFSRDHKMVLLHMAVINSHLFLDIQILLYCKNKYCVTLACI